MAWVEVAQAVTTAGRDLCVVFNGDQARRDIQDHHSVMKNGETFLGPPTLSICRIPR